MNNGYSERSALDTLSKSDKYRKKNVGTGIKSNVGGGKSSVKARSSASGTQVVVVQEAAAGVQVVAVVNLDVLQNWLFLRHSVVQ